jgi:hypothetical protein
MANPAGPRRILSLVIEHTKDLPLATVDPGSEDWAAATVGQRLRQWYSRLRLVRYALYQGQAAYADKLLAGVCPASDACRACPPLPMAQVMGAPTSCDPACSWFSLCNPGYADAPGTSLQSDAQRMAVQVVLQIAGSCAATRPRLLEAAQAWLRGRMLAQALHDYDGYVQAVIAQVLGLLEVFWKDHEHTAALMDRVVAAVPHDTLKGRLVDCLTDRGIRRWNEDLFEQGVQDLRWAIQLNPHSLRCRKNLCVALRQLASKQFGDDIQAAIDAARELQRVAGSGGDGTHTAAEAAEFQEYAAWAQQRVAEWQQLAARDADPLGWLLRAASAPPES